jgi:hypothetical protein
MPLLLIAALIVAAVVTLAGLVAGRLAVRRDRERHGAHGVDLATDYRLTP